MSHDPRVSVIVIFLDAEKFIQEAIESVLTQTYRNWELLLVDDGSTDGSTDIARRQAERLPSKVRYLEHAGHRNLGMSASRNLGIKNAAGSYVAFLDADDVWLPNKLAEQVAILEDIPEAALVYGPAQLWRSWTGHAKDLARDRVQKVGVEVNALAAPQTLIKLFLRNDATVSCPSCVLVRREIAELAGGFEDAFKGLYEDQAFLAKVCLRAPVYVAGNVWLKKRIHSDMSTSVAIRAGQSHISRRFFLEWLDDYLARVAPRAFGLRAEVWRDLALYRFPLAGALAARLALVKPSLRLLRRAFAAVEKRVTIGLRFAFKFGRQG